MYAISVSKSEQDSDKYYPMNRGKLKIESASDLSATSFYFDTYSDAIVAENALKFLLDNFKHKKNSFKKADQSTLKSFN